MQGKSFNNVIIIECNLKGTHANIDPQKVKNKSLCFANLERLNMKDKLFDGVNIIGCNLKNTNANIDPDKVYNKNLTIFNKNNNTKHNTNLFLFKDNTYYKYIDINKFFN